MSLLVDLGKDNFSFCLIVGVLAASSLPSHASWSPLLSFSPNVWAGAVIQHKCVWYRAINYALDVWRMHMCPRLTAA